jgi:uncharacterized protein (DUF2236 family)
VAATLYDTARRVHDRVFGPAEPALADELYRDYAALGTALQLPAEMWPEDRASFRDYWNNRILTLDVTEDARQVAHDLFAPVTAPRWLRAGLPLARILTLDLLPSSVRESYGFEWTPLLQRRADRAWAVVRALTRVTPHRLRSTPARRYLRRLRRA